MVEGSVPKTFAEGRKHLRFVTAFVNPSQRVKHRLAVLLSYLTARYTIAIR
ncbi:MAG TPA: hypothetical protein VLU47_16430 [Blastocatellia bacterium]|nr:hypothetical protein [Blastocatellia bacterium]